MDGEDWSMWASWTGEPASVLFDCYGGNLELHIK